MYKIKKYKSYRPRTDYIIFTQSVNLIRSDLYINPIVLRGNYKFTWGIWQEYFMHDMFMDDVPCHYFCEQLDKDYVIYKGCAEPKESIFLRQLFNAGIIEPQYKNAILIVLQDNFEWDIPERRMWDHINSKLLSDLLRRYHLDFSRVKLLEKDCLTPNWKDRLAESNLKYELNDSYKHFNEIILKQSIQFYHKFV